MKTTTVLLILALLLSLAGIASAELVAHYEFEGNANDSAGANHGSLIGNPTWGSGVFGQAIDLDGAGDYINCGNSPIFNMTSKITVAAWVNIRTIPVDWMTVVSKGDSAWRLSMAWGDRRFQFAVTGPPAYHSVNGEIWVTTGEWHHVCGTYDGANIRLYVDGVLDISAAYDGGVATNTFDVCIGENAEVPGRCWDGFIDELSIYNHALNSSEIDELVNIPSEADAAFTYQGRLLNNNMVADGLYDFQFKLYDAAVAGTQQGATVNTSAVDVIDGYFTVDLDFGKEIFDGNERWLEVSVRPGDSTDSFTVLGPRQKITPTPYAIYAEKAGSGGAINLIDVSETDAICVDNDGKVGIGTTSPAYELDVQGDVRATGGFTAGSSTRYRDGFITNTPSTESLTIGDESAATVFIDTTNNQVGIGTTSPDARAKLEVNGQVKIAGGAPGAGKVLTSDANGLASWQIPTDGGGPDGDWMLSGDGMYSIPTGNVGIGTDTIEPPYGAKLKVINTASGMYGIWAKSDHCAGIYGTGVNAGGVVGNSTTNNGVAGTSDSGNGVYGNSQTGHGVHGSAGADGYAGYFDGRGYFRRNVGINVEAPTSKLEVTDSTGRPTIKSINTGSGIGIYSESDSGYGVHGKSNTNYGIFGEGNNYGVVASSPSGIAGYFDGPKNFFNGKVGIGQIDPESKLHITASNPEIRLEDSGGKKWHISVYGSGLVFSETTVADRMYIAEGGNVGIGTRNPQQKLDINGILRVRNFATGADYPLYVNNNGDLVKLTSSKRYKKDIIDLKVDPERVCELRPVKFKWKESNEQDVGLIAEDVGEVIKDLVVYDSEGRPDAVKYERVALYLLAVVKAQQEKIRSLVEESKDQQQKIASLEETVAQNGSVMYRLEALERAMGQYKLAVAKEVR